ncbi:cordon-bleu protein-like 1 [Trichomycterus rosablanca]|uniref:cordon-bleu protein-like 1 n=1 Tax=Trichomycterus rosablanca TaxID=2290929 RepID=UPI002F353C07
MPAVCDKCELDPKTTVLLRDIQSEEPLDLTKSLNDYGIRDLYAKELKAVTEDPATPTHKDYEKSVTHEKVNRGLLGLFMRGKKTGDENVSSTNSASTSLVLNNQINISSPKSSLVLSTPTSDMSKKRRAPQPPSMSGSQSISSRLISSQDATLPKNDACDKQGVLSCVSTDLSLKRTKRKAPPPPGISPSQPDSSDKERPYAEASVNHNYLEDAQQEELSGAHFNQYSNFPPPSPLMKEILFEFMDRLKAQGQVELSSDGSPASNHTSNLHCSLHKSVDSRNCDSLSQRQEAPQDRRDGLNTFTVVPRKKTQSPRQYEFVITLETSESGETGKKLKGGNDNRKNSEPRESTNNQEYNTNTMVTHEKTEHVNNVDKTCGNLDILEATEKELDMIKLYTYTENHLDKGREMEDQVVLEERDWEVMFKEKRKIFQNGVHCEEAVNLKRCTMSSDKAVVEDVVEKTTFDFKPPSPPSYWKEDDCETQHVKKSEKAEMIGIEKKAEDKETSTTYPTAPRREHHRDPYWKTNLDTIQVPFKYQSPDSVSKFGLNSSLSNEKPSSENITQSENPSLVDFKNAGPNSNSEPHQSFKLPVACLVSPFALAVSQRAMSVGKRGYPLNLSARGLGSSILLHLNTAEGMCK